MTKQFILPLLLLPYWVMAAQSTDVNFIYNPTEAQVRAANEGKLYFVHFTTTWCMPCQWMEENTFTNDTLADFVAAHYLAVKIDLDDRNAANYKQQYKITAIPSLLIFNAKGELLARYETSLSKEELLQKLQQYVPAQRQKQNSNSTLAVQVNYNGAAPAAGKISRPALIPDEVNKVDKTLAYNASPSSTAIDKTPLPATASARAEPVSRFAIQVGVFSDFGNAERTRTHMEQRFQLPVQIVESRQDGKHFYKVMVGKFETKEDANHFLDKIHAQAVQGYVKNIDN